MARGKYRGRGRGGGRRAVETNEDGFESSEGDFETRGPRGQASTVGLLPPSDSDSDEYDESGDEKTQRQEPPQVGELPPSEDEGDSDEGDSDEGDEQDAVPNGRRIVNGNLEASGRRGKKEQIAEEQVRVDLERLELVKKRREEQRRQRIADEGWDRFAPISETNKPPVPADHPSMGGV